MNSSSSSSASHTSLGGDKKKEFPKWQKYIIEKFWLLSVISFAVIIILCVLVIVISKSTEKKAFRVPNIWAEPVSNVVQSIYNNYSESELAGVKGDFVKEYTFLIIAQSQIDILKQLLRKRIVDVNPDLLQLEKDIAQKMSVIAPKLPPNMHRNVIAAREGLITEINTNQKPKKKVLPKKTKSSTKKANDNVSEKVEIQYR